MDAQRLTRRGLAQAIWVLAAASWLGSLVVLVVLTFDPTDEPTYAWGYWSTGVWLLVTLPVLLVLGRRLFGAALPRIGPRGDLDQTDDDVAARHHKGLDGEIPPPVRW